MSLFPLAVILVMGLSIMVKGKPSSCFSLFSFLGTNPTYSIILTDEILNDASRMDSLLTASRLNGIEIAFGDFSVGMNECQARVKVKWENNSSQQLIIRELPNKDKMIVAPRKSADYTFSIQGDYPYLLNEYPKIIHVGAAGNSPPSYRSDLNAFCKRFAKREAQIIFLGEISYDELNILLSSAHLELEGIDPYRMVLVKVPPTFERERDLSILRDHPLFGNITFDCSFKENG